MRSQQLLPDEEVLDAIEQLLDSCSDRLDGIVARSPLHQFVLAETDVDRIVLAEVPTWIGRPPTVVAYAYDGGDAPISMVAGPDRTVAFTLLARHLLINSSCTECGRTTLLVSDHMPKWVVGKSIYDEFCLVVWSEDLARYVRTHDA